jgi:pimeloyl-ACP methyl ester carboxylesterase
MGQAETRWVESIVPLVRSTGRRARAVVTTLACGLLMILCAAGVAPAQARNTSLYRGPGPAPGPALLYEPLAVAPQLQNAAPWKAEPILISGAEAYRKGEFLYQGFLFDDHGAESTPDPKDPFSPVSFLFSPKRGTITYPTNPVYANNAADLVEFRVKPLRKATAFRVTLNTLKDPELVAFTVALGESPAAVSWPFDAGVESPGQLFLTVHGTTAVLTNATGEEVKPAPTVSASMVRRQFEVSVPHAAWNPGSSVVRMEAGVGLWDTETGEYLRPGAEASETQPGGCATSCPAFFDMAFRTQEPVPRIYEPGTSNTIVEGGVQAKKDGTWWREREQAEVLATGNVSQFNAEVDFAKLLAHETDESAVPKTGNMDRIMASHFEFGQGVDYEKECLTGKVTNPEEKECSGPFIGQLQPYAVYVPNKPVPPGGFGLIVSMHGLSANYNEFLGSHEASEMAEEGTGSIFASPEARGPDGSYENYAEADVFEMWADIADHYQLNPEKADVTGYSMGGDGTYRLASRWPDLFARAFSIVGSPSEDELSSLRNIPVMDWDGSEDELDPPATYEAAFLNAEKAGLRYDERIFAPAGHITLGNNDEFKPAAEFFGDNTVDRNPYHVTYLVDPSETTQSVGASNHAYWLSGLTVRTAGETGEIDAFSHAQGLGDPPALPLEVTAGVLEGGSHGPLPYTRRTLAWSPAPTEKAEDRLVVTATNLATATVTPKRAGLNCKAKVEVTSNGPFELTLAGCNRVIHAE